MVTGDLERYGFLAQEMFQRFDIPYFLDQTNKLVLNPFIEFIRSALLVVIQEYSYEAVFSFPALRHGGSDAGRDRQTGKLLSHNGNTRQKAWHKNLLGA